MQSENAQLRENYKQETERHHQLVSQLEEKHCTAVAAFEATIAEMNQAVAQHDKQWKEYLRSETASFDHDKRTLKEQIINLNCVIEGLRRQEEAHQLKDEHHKVTMADSQNTESPEVLRERCNVLSLQLAHLTVNPHYKNFDDNLSNFLACKPVCESVFFTGGDSEGGR